MRTEPFEISHAVDIRVHSKQAQYQSWLKSGVLPVETTSLFYDDELVCVGGLVRFDNKTWAWLMFTDKITPGRFVAIYREMKRRLAELLEAGETVLVHIDPNYPEALRMAVKLGFREDGEDRFEGRSMIRMVAGV